MLLHIWAMEHFFQREPTIDYFVGTSYMICSHNEKIRNWATPHGQGEWRELLTHLSGEFINSKLSWLGGGAILRSLGKYFIKLVGLEVIQPYVPLRVLRQLGLIQEVPFWSRRNL